MAVRKPRANYARHPIVQYVRSLPEELYLAREVAEQVGCTKAMLLYISRHSDAPMGPTHQARYGATVLHLYTPERIDQIREYFRREVTKADKGYRQKGPVQMWTHTERVERRRQLDRARAYRRRAVRYREQGDEEKAARMDRESAAVTAQMEAAKAKRWRKVHGTKK
jgi:hypothetical protein